MKKVLLGLIVGVLIGVMGFSYAQTESYTALKAEFKVLVNGEEFNSDKPAVVIDGSTYLPLKAIGEALGVNVTWNSKLGQVEIGKVFLPDGIKVFEDEKVKISFIKTTQNEIDFLVDNKTDTVVTIQANALAINGFGATDILMSDSIAPKSKGLVSADCKTNLSGSAETISGQLRIIDFSESFESYDAKFVNVKIK